MLHQYGGKARYPDVRTRETTLLGHIFMGYIRYQVGGFLIVGLWNSSAWDACLQGLELKCVWWPQRMLIQMGCHVSVLTNHLKHMYACNADHLHQVRPHFTAV